MCNFIVPLLFTRRSCDFLLQAACGITKKPKEEIIDIDAADVDNELAAVEYLDDIYKFYKLVEVLNLVPLIWFCVLSLM